MQRTVNSLGSNTPSSFLSDQRNRFARPLPRNEKRKMRRVARCTRNEYWEKKVVVVVFLFSSVVVRLVDGRGSF